MLLRHVNVIILILILSVSIDIQEREPFLSHCVRGTLQHWLSYRHLHAFFHNPYILETIRLLILIPVLDLNLRLQLYEKAKIPELIFSQRLQSIRVNFSMLPQPGCLWRPMLNLFCTVNIEGRIPCLSDYVKYTFNICVRLDVWESISFRFDIMINTINFYSLMPV